MDGSDAVGQIYARLASFPRVEAFTTDQVDELVAQLRNLIPKETLESYELVSDFEHCLELVPDWLGIAPKDIQPGSSSHPFQWSCGPVLVRGNLRFLFQTGPYENFEELEAAWNKDMMTTVLLFALGALHEDAQLVNGFLDGETVPLRPTGGQRHFRVRDGVLQELVDHYSLIHGRPQTPLVEPTLWDFLFERQLHEKHWQRFPAGVASVSLAGREHEVRIAERRLTVGEWTFPFGRCPICNQVFFRPRRGKPRRFCSEKCKIRGIPFAARRGEYVRGRRQRIREGEIAIALEVVNTSSKTERFRRLQKRLKRKSRPQLLYLLRQAEARATSETISEDFEV